MKRRCWILGTFVVLASLALFVTSTGAQPGTVKQIVPGVWFREEVREMTIFSEQYDFTITLLLVGDRGPYVHLAETDREEDTYDRFMGQH